VCSSRSRSPPRIGRWNGAALAVDARARRTIAVALAYLAGDPDRALLLARDHLADLLVAHVAARLEGNPLP
jgi:prolyl-tRNA editing enzyme YbaK/EbsC (Cys-tRNA(Pro) deacylase)